MMVDCPFPSLTRICNALPHGLVMIEQTVLIWFLLIIIVIVKYYYYYYYCYELFLMTALKNICYTVYIILSWARKFFGVQYFTV